MRFGFLAPHLGHGPQLQEGRGRKWQFIPTLLVGWRHLHRKPREAQATGCCSGCPQGTEPPSGVPARPAVASPGWGGAARRSRAPTEVCPAGGRTSGNAGSALALVPSERPGVIWVRRPSLHRGATWCHTVPRCAGRSLSVLLSWLLSSFVHSLTPFLFCVS